MNIGRFIDVHYAENDEGTYNINELGIYFEDTTDKALNSLIEDSLCFLGADGEPPAITRHSVRIASFHTGRVYTRYAYIVLEGLPTMFDREWQRTTIPVSLTADEAMGIATLAVKSFIEAMDEAYSE